MDSHLKLTAHIGDPLPHPEEYQQLLGKLIYITLIRSEITFHRDILSKFMHSPTTIHLQAAKRVLRYLSSTPLQGILLASSSNAHLATYCDSDWAGCATTRRSTSGFCVMLGKPPISSKSKRQSVVAKAIAEAEYRLMAMTVCEVIWLIQLLKDLGLKHQDTTHVFYDNQTAFAISSNQVHHEKKNMWT